MIRINNILTRCTSGVTMGGRITGGGGSTWTLNFTGGDCNLIDCLTNSQTIPENVTLYFETTVTSGGYQWLIRKNGVDVFFGLTSNTDPPELTTTLTFSINDTFIFIFNGVGTGTMTIKENNSSGRLIDDFPIVVADN